MTLCLLSSGAPTSLIGGARGRLGRGAADQAGRDAAAATDAAAAVCCYSIICIYTMYTSIYIIKLLRIVLICLKRLFSMKLNLFDSVI